MSRTFGDYAASPTKRQKRSTRSADREVSGSPQTESGFWFARSGARRPPVNRTPGGRCHPRAATAMAAGAAGSAREPVVDEASTADGGEGRQGDEE